MKKELRSRLIRVAKVLEKLDTLKKKAGSYTIKMTPAEYRGLRLLADKYESAGILFNGLECVNDSDAEYTQDCGTYNIPEHVLWESYDATEGDGGGLGIIPNLGGNLGKQINHLFDNMV